MSDRGVQRRRRLPVLAPALALVLTLVLALATLTVPTGPVAAGAPAGAAERRSAAEKVVAQCARPALAPALAVRPGAGGSKRASRAVDAAVLGRTLKVPARAQALAVAAVLAGDVAGGKEQRAFYRGLSGVKSWATLPPSIAVHRVLGTPDPFAHEDDWDDAVALLARLVKDGNVGQLVGAGGRSPATCHARKQDPSTLPLPPGSSYRVETVALEPAQDDTQDGPKNGPKNGKGGKGEKGDRPQADQPQEETRFVAPCGTPVLAATAGEVEVLEGDAETGPWLLRVDSGDAVTEYTHVRAPLVAHGDTVLVGDQLAEVGDLGNVAECALGLRLDVRGKAAGPVDPVRYLTRSIEPPEPEPVVVPETQFRVATYNVLGHHLTAPGGGKPGWAPGTTRVAQGLARVEAAGISIVVFNEFESPQADVVARDGDWQVHRATPNNVLRGGSTNGNGIAWRTDTWKLLATDEFTVPWKVTLHMPVVYLEHQETGAVVSVIGIHNPASTRKAGNQQPARELARRIQLEWITTQQQRYPGVPVILAGDFNERDTAFCGLTGTGVLASSAGGSVGSPCQVPRHGPVDWIFGTTQLDFLGQTIDRSFLGRITDHPLVSATVSFPAHEAPELG